MSKTVQSVNRQYIAKRCSNARGMRKATVIKPPKTVAALVRAFNCGEVKISPSAGLSTPLAKAFEYCEKVRYDDAGADRVMTQVKKDAATILDLLAVNDPKNLDKVAKMFSAFVAKWEKSE